MAVKPGEWVTLTETLMGDVFTTEMRERRNLLLREVADNDVNARRIIETIDNYNPEQ